MYIENVLKVKNDWWRYFIGCCVVFIATQIGSIPFIIAIFSKVGVEGSSQIDQFTMMTVLGDSNLTLFYFLIPFLFGLLGLFIVLSTPIFELLINSLISKSDSNISGPKGPLNFSRVIS